MGKKKIAVIGSGISGLGTAYLLSYSHDHEVHLFEKNNRFGGHSNTISVSLNGTEFKIDTGFIVYNDNNYRNFSSLLNHLSIKSKWSDMSLGFSFNQGRFEYACDNLDKIFSQRRNILNGYFLKCLLEILRFNREAPKFLDSGKLSSLSLRDFLKIYRYSSYFRDHFILPMAGAIWSTSLERVLDFPAENFVSFFRNHDLLNGLGPARKWRTLEGGSERYVNEIVRRLGRNSKAGAEVSMVSRNENGCLVTFNDGSSRAFDHVIFATAAPLVKRLLSNQDKNEASILSKFKTTRNRAFLHSDEGSMPKRKKVWSSWNFLYDSGADSYNDPPAVTYWMNRLQGLDKSTNFFVSLNPREKIEPSKVYYETEYSHPQFDLNSLDAQSEILKIQGNGGIWYVGAWLGYGFHEDGLMSAIKIAKEFKCLPSWLNDSDLNSKDC
ncbi:MAG: NAD(P)/FAD-dependent oxidoreductase [Paracoccaceae bacterium]